MLFNVEGIVAVSIGGSFYANRSGKTIAGDWQIILAL